MSYADISIIIAGTVALSAVATFIAHNAGRYLTIREHEAYQKAMEFTMVDVDKRITRLEHKIFNGK